jgi:transglutaminase-like putative cysteine protease
MLIRAGYELVFRAPVPTAMMLLLSPHPSRDGDLQQPEVLRTEPETPFHQFVDWFGNRCTRLVAPVGQIKITGEIVVRDDGRPDPQNDDAVQHPVEDLPDGVLRFLMSSRYCEVDRLGEVAWPLFDQAPTGWGRVKAVCDYVHSHVRFGYDFARATKTAYDVYAERAGVCRDFTHLAIALCRCLNIPARYATGYLGDIGVPVSDTPMDFSAWFEVYLGGRWHTFDARHNRPRIGRILMAHGRDAADAALTTSFGAATLEQFRVWTDEVR